MKYFALRLLALIVLICTLIWAFSASFLAALSQIDVKLELRSYWWMMSIAILCTSVGYITFRKAKSPLWGILFAIFAIAAILTNLVMICGLSDSLFLNRKIKAVPVSKWRELQTALNDFTTNSTEEATAITVGNLAPSFANLGRTNEFAFGFAQKPECKTCNMTALVAFGYQSRRWGIFNGDQEVLLSRFPKARVVLLGTSYYFFVANN